jgi:hypothetical protein
MTEEQFKLFMEEIYKLNDSMVKIYENLKVSNDNTYKIINKLKDIHVELFKDI